MKLDAAWGIIKQFVEPELQVLAGQQGTTEVWDALRSVETALKLPPRAPRPRGWVEPPRLSSSNPASPVAKTTKKEPTTKKKPAAKKKQPAKKKK